MIETDHKALKHIYRELIMIVTAAVNEWDPYALIKGGAPEDEFSEEVSRIAAKVLDIKSSTAKLKPIKTRNSDVLQGKRLVVLDIPDNYGHINPELVRI
ncbi:hypothetical protein Geob_1831 [Geotalea daltonii FRC-32]|uniref:Uncharacterized protein n=1 Tax=Geotalea daltonii (strain DSM 22248 / JCM 15807 / FRC-32) TaxID=316067 RepID=B9M7A1_GEODF|nr:hypothetical protein [Geotalea daltonii]ACM20189.2 hypothetical protein Geob_1831 [Geotalea daltonii FRC-32]